MLRVWSLIMCIVVACGGDGPREENDGGAPDATSDAGTVDAGPPLPALLSETGLLEGDAIAPRVLAYEVRHPLWTDGLEKRRFLLLPAGASIDTSDPDHWVFPAGTRVFKEFRLDGELLETRMVWRAGPGADDWVSVSYVPTADGTDAEARPAGVVDTAGSFHDVPDAFTCVRCHGGEPSFVLGISALQLDAESFAAWQAAGVLDGDAIYAEVPGDETEASALGYLHGNCAHCHNDTNFLAPMRSLRLRLPVGLSNASDAPALGDIGVAAHHALLGTTVNLVPGDPEASQLYMRLTVRNLESMPPVGTERVDEVGLASVRAWIERLGNDS